MRAVKSALIVGCVLCLSSAEAKELDWVATQYWVKECVDINESEMCIGYFIALGHANSFAVVTNGKPLWCSGQASILQKHAVVMKFTGDNPKIWDEPFFIIAVMALGKAFPCKERRWT